jgi:hypothetical protein
MLVLVSAYKSWLKPLVDYPRLIRLMERTIILHQRLSPLSRVFRINYQVLREAQKELTGEIRVESKPQISSMDWHHGSHESPVSRQDSQSSMASPASMTPIHYATPGPISAHSSFTG